MLWKIAMFTIAGSIALLGPVGATLATTGGEGRPPAAGKGEAVLARDEDADGTLITVERDDDDSRDGNSGSFTSGVNSNDGTNSRRTGVTRSNRDRSRGDLTKDRTKDGRGGPTRDRTKNHTNDRSRHDTRRG